jgi:polyphenol oxidase
VNADSLLQIDWPLPPGVGAAFTTRLGGVSVPPWDSFNVGAHVGDAPTDVAANRARLVSLLGLRAEPAWLSQVHGVEVADPDCGLAAPGPVTADAAVTSGARPCVIMVADCLPVLFASADGRRLGAAHAGWRGLAAGVLERTVAALGVPAGELTAWLGPAISQRHFEVGPEVRDAFVTAEPGAADFFVPNLRERWQADLIGLARRKLEKIGLRSVHGGQWCTYGDERRFFSHRRDGHHGSGRTGRMAALIWRA